MNFLAHAYLSFEYKDILVGNLITDFVGAYHKQDYPAEVRAGIALHHEIDAFTDMHQATLKAKECLRPATGRYCGVFMDVVYDHFLANDKNRFSLVQLAEFSQNTYKVLDARYHLLPEKFKGVFAYMKKEDWLLNYHTEEGIRNSFMGIYRRASFLKKSDAAFNAFLQDYEKFQKAYQLFMPEMVTHAQAFLRSKGTF